MAVYNYEEYMGEDSTIDVHDYDSLLKAIIPVERRFRAGDIIKIPYNGENIEFVILGVNINPNPGEKVDYDFIDIMSKELIIPDSKGVRWGCVYDYDLDESEFAFLNFAESNIIEELHSKLKLFPQDIQDACISRKMRFLDGFDMISHEKRYSTIDVGKVWLPSLKEIFGFCSISNSDHESEQYPYFVDESNRILNGRWWISSAEAFNGEFAYYMEPSDKNEYCYMVTSPDEDGIGAPLCIRLKIH